MQELEKYYHSLLHQSVYDYMKASHLLGLIVQYYIHWTYLMLISICHFCYLLKDNIENVNKNGLFAMYHENGIRSFRWEYFDGVGIGKWVYYNEESVIIRKNDCDFE